MQIRSRIRTGKPENKFEEVLEEELLSFSLELSRILNKGLELSDNFNGQIRTYTTNGVANTEDTVAHTLKRVPIGFLILNKNKAADLYDSGTAWTASNLFLKCSVASATVKVIIF